MSAIFSKSIKPHSKSWLLLMVLLAGKTLGTMEIIHGFRTTRPAAIIHYLRRGLNVPIETMKEERIGSNGMVICSARYRITPSLLQEQRERFGV